MADDVVLLDTDVWSLLFTARRDRNPEVIVWRQLLLGRLPVIAAQTEAELRFGAEINNWGPARLAALQSQLVRTPTLPVTSAVIHAFVTVRSGCHRAGHSLSAKQHTGDAWVAATASAYDVPLLSGDGIFVGAPGIRLLTET